LFCFTRALFTTQLTVRWMNAGQRKKRMTKRADETLGGVPGLLNQGHASGVHLGTVHGDRRNSQILSKWPKWANIFRRVFIRVSTDDGQDRRKY